jgi:hypothetical protein
MKSNYSDREILHMIGHLLEAHPTTGIAARDKAGREVEPESPEACSFCLIGARRAVMSKLFHDDNQNYYYVREVRIHNLLTKILDSPNECLLNSWEPVDGNWPEVQRTTIEKLKNA